MTTTTNHPADLIHNALRAMGHSVTLDAKGHTIVAANPDRAGKWGEITEADWQAAEAAAGCTMYEAAVTPSTAARKVAAKAAAAK